MQPFGVACSMLPSSKEKSKKSEVEQGSTSQFWDSLDSSFTPRCMVGSFGRDDRQSGSFQDWRGRRTGVRIVEEGGVAEGERARVGGGRCGRASANKQSRVGVLRQSSQIFEVCMAAWLSPGEEREVAEGKLVFLPVSIGTKLVSLEVWSLLFVVQLSTRSLCVNNGTLVCALCVLA